MAAIVSATLKTAYAACQSSSSSSPPYTVAAATNSHSTDEVATSHWWLRSAVGDEELWRSPGSCSWRSSVRSLVRHVIREMTEIQSRCQVVDRRATSAASCARVVKSSLRNVWARWLSTVRREMWRRSPISGLVRPCATRSLTVSSIGVSDSHPNAGRGRRAAAARPAIRRSSSLARARSPSAPIAANNSAASSSRATARPPVAVGGELQREVLATPGDERAERGLAEVLEGLAEEHRVAGDESARLDRATDRAPDRGPCRAPSSRHSTASVARSSRSLAMASRSSNEERSRYP